ncbi:MAG: HAD family hydrolase [Phycisphaerales bacterium]
MGAPRTSHPRFDAIVCDIDGCLSPELPRPMQTGLLARVSEHNRRARERGDTPLLTLCTGRPLPFAEAMARAVGAFDLPIVCEGGVWLLTMDPYLWEMDPRVTREHLELVREVGAWATAQFEGSFLEAGKSAAVTIFHERGPEYLESVVMPAVWTRINDERWPLRASMTWTCVNVELEFVSKASGIDRLLDRTGLVRERLAGIGDTMGDMAIRERVAWFACPANAADELKPHADYVSPHEEVEGVLDILDRLSQPRA